MADYVPRITAHPQTAEVDDGGRVTLTVTATNLTALNYQWQFNGTNLAGATGPRLDLTQIGEATQGEYRVIVSSVAGSVASEAACVSLKVAIPPAPEGMVWIPPGTFTMGSPVGEADRVSDEEPQHVVKLTKGFYMSRYEVTQARYELVKIGRAHV